MDADLSKNTPKGGAKEAKVEDMVLEPELNVETLNMSRRDNSTARLGPSSSQASVSLAASLTPCPPQTSRTPTQARTVVYLCVAVAVPVCIIETSVGKQKLVAKGPRLGLCL